MNIFASIKNKFYTKSIFMKRILLLFSIVFAAATVANAQTYTTAIGAKFYAGNSTFGGINIRYANTEHTALEGSLLFASGVAGLEGLYQYQAPINGANGLQYFVGGGGFLGFGDNTTFALRLTGGIDYKFEDAPINVSLGLDPFFTLTPETGSSLTLGIGLRYVLK